MRGVHRLNEWKSAFIKPLQVVSEKISFILLRNSKNYFSIDLNSREILSNSFIQFKSYENYEQNLEVQRIKTERRLRVFKEESKSIMWTKEINIKDISNLIKDHGQGAIISGLCMGSRSGEEQTLFHKFLGKNSKVFGVELHSDAKSLPNTIIADFHYPPKNLFGKFDFVYSNSHDQSFNPKLAIGSWIKCLKVDGLLVLEHSRSHGKLRTNRQDPFGVETEILPFLIMCWFSANLRLEGIYEPSKPFDNAHKYFVFSKKM
jgi:hypothetical protein